MRRSVPAFILGLVGSLFSLWWGFISGIGGGLVGSIIGAAGASDGGITTTISLLGWLAFLGAIVGFVGSGNCFKKARVGGIMLAVTTLMCSPIQIYYFVKSVSAATMMIPTIIIVFLLPVVLLVVATVLALCARKRGEDPNMEKAYVNPQPQVVVNTVTQPAAQPTNMEQELAKLKEMNEKGLITDDEYAEARKKVIDKHM